MFKTKAPAGRMFCLSGISLCSSLEMREMMQIWVRNVSLDTKWIENAPLNSCRHIEICTEDEAADEKFIGSVLGISI